MRVAFTRARALLLLLGQAAFEASNVLVVLEGRTPGGEHDHLLGAYAPVAEPPTSRCATKPHPWRTPRLHVEDDGIWVAGASADVGGLAGGLMARDAVCRPTW